MVDTHVDGWSPCENQVGQIFLESRDLGEPTEVLGLTFQDTWLVYGNNQSFGQSLLYVPWFHLKWFLHFWCIEIIDQKQIILAKRQGSNPPFDLTPHVFIISPSLELANGEHAHEASLELWTFSAGFTWDAFCKGYKVGPKTSYCYKWSCLYNPYK